MIILPLAHPGNAQVIDAPETVLTPIDSIGKYYSQNNFSDTKKATAVLLPFCKSDMDKARCIYSFVTHRIKYDFSSTAFDANDVLKHKYAVCQGYANLIDAMFAEAQLQCKIITGYTKPNLSVRNHNLSRTNHAWNAVKIEGIWQLVDATWGAGFYDYGTRKFTAQYETNYFMASPLMMKYTHYSTDTIMTMLTGGLPAQTFIDYPYAWRGFEANNITSISPDKFKLKIKKGSNFIIEFSTNETVSDPLVQIEGEAYSKQVQVTTLGNNKYVATVPINFLGKKEVTFFFNNTGVVTYEVSSH